jgi:hypothetical protein
MGLRFCPSRGLCFLSRTTRLALSGIFFNTGSTEQLQATNHGCKDPKIGDKVATFVGLR